MIRRYLLDTGIAQDFQEDRNGVRDRAIAERNLGHRVGICVPVLGELWSGVECSASRERNLRSLRKPFCGGLPGHIPRMPPPNSAAFSPS